MTTECVDILVSKVELAQSITQSWPSIRMLKRASNGGFSKGGFSLEGYKTPASSQVNMTKKSGQPGTKGS
ncbi:hypothetical protein Hypma_003345 [Hypsizygus marmoreus]|uniref:Uncharacterized protein n=1 Tax=Hypsizygus marmoreus TaxID=39966 RepID=A0A369J8T0_HYPMA|nr:hypothetical protein Hypma_003345 [Hypsizygus marmoreus]